MQENSQYSIGADTARASGGGSAGASVLRRTTIPVIIQNIFSDLDELKNAMQALKASLNSVSDIEVGNKEMDKVSRTRPDPTESISSSVGYIQGEIRSLQGEINAVISRLLT